METLIDTLIERYKNINIIEFDKNNKNYSQLIINNKFKLLISYSDFMFGYWFDIWVDDVSNSKRFASFYKLTKWIDNYEE